MNRPRSTKMEIPRIYAPVGAPGGAETEIQFHHGADFGADAGLTFDHDTQVFTAPEARFLLQITTASESRDVTVAECKGAIILATGAIILTLPAVVKGYHVTIYGVSGQTILTVNPNDNDRIIVNGAPELDGVAIVSPAGAGNYVQLVGDSANGWTVICMSGAWDGA